jgi:hypothetical protein
MSDWNMGPFKPNPRHAFDPSEHYKYFDLVRYKGGGYLNINEDLVDGISCTGILPTGQEESESYWMCICEPGATGSNAEAYLPFVVLEDGDPWDFALTDKIVVPSDYGVQLVIDNVYDGCCGMIVTENKNLQLPDNSDRSVDFNYVNITDNQYYVYTFVCMNYGGELKFLWNRTVMNRE